jgi:hypothetical protein
MTKDKFLEAIDKIGWRVQKSWNGLNDKLVSPTGIITDIRVSGDKLEPYSNKLYGGESFQMTVCWYYKDAIYNEADGFISIDNLLLMNH